MRPRLLALGVSCLATALASRASPAQTPRDTTQAAQDSAIRAFLDCPDYPCDFDYFRTEITFVNWVRDRQYAQVHILLTSQRTGGGGREFTLAFIGLKEFQGTADTLRFVSGNTATQDEIRGAIARTVRLGLMRFVARTPLAERIQISYSGPPTQAAQVHDPWNYWVFALRVNGNMDGERTFRSQNLSGGLSADRVTDRWKINLSTNESARERDFLHVPVLDSTGTQIGEKTVRSITRSYGANALVVKSLGPHWSAGVSAGAFSSTRSNQRLALNAGPAIEFDVFPYSQSTRKLLTLHYRIGVSTFQYRDTTIFDKLEETLGRQSLSLSLDVKQPWGSAGVSLEGGHYLQDFKKNLLELFGNGNFRLYKGLSVQFFGQIALIHDQLSIAKGAATEEEVLLQLRQLQTSYSYFGFFALRYTFGSKFANVVNPRFGGGGGGFFISN